MTKFLNISVDNTLGGNSPSDEVVSSQKAIKEYVDNNGGSVSTDGISINQNSSNELQTIGVINQNNSSQAINVWSGTKAEYDLLTPDPNTIYHIIDDETPASFANTDLSNLSASGQAIIDGKANTSLNNLTSTGKNVLDGQWITATTTTIASGVSGDSTYSNEFDLSSFLPNDGQAYDCLFYADGRTGTTSGNTIRIYLTTSLITGGVLVVFGNTRTSSSGYAGGACIIPVGTNRKVTMSLDYTGGTATNIELRLAGYRRIGTNS